MESITDAAQRLEAIRTLLGHTALLSEQEWAELRELEAAAFPYAAQHGEDSVIGPREAGDPVGEKWLARYEELLHDAQRRAQVDGAPAPSIPTVETSKVHGGPTTVISYTTGSGQTTVRVSGRWDTWAIHLYRTADAPQLDHRDGMRACVVSLVDRMWPQYGDPDLDQPGADPRPAARQWLDDARLPDWVRVLVQAAVSDWEPDQRQWQGAWQRGERGAPTTLQLADRLGVSVWAFRPWGGFGEHQWLSENEERVMTEAAERKARPVAVLHDHPTDGDDPDGTPPATPGAAAMPA